MPNEVVLVRHGATEWATSGRHTGRTDIPLDDEGRAQAKALARPSRRVELLARADEPAAARARDVRARRARRRAPDRADLAEWDYGDYEGLTTEQIRETRPGVDVFDGSASSTARPSSRSACGPTACSRGSTAVDGAVALFSHGHMLRILGARWLGLPPVDGRAPRPRHATLSVLGYEHDTRVIRRWNG